MNPAPKPVVPEAIARLISAAIRAPYYDHWNADAARLALEQAVAAEINVERTARCNFEAKCARLAVENELFDKTNETLRAENARLRETLRDTAQRYVKDAAALKSDLARECNAADEILRYLGLSPDSCRTEGGALNVSRTKTLWEDGPLAHLETVFRALNGEPR